MKPATEEKWTLSQQSDGDDIAVLRFEQPGEYMSMSVRKDRAELMEAAPDLYRALERYVSGEFQNAEGQYDLLDQAYAALKKAKPR